jgi:hypothetical protein
MRPPATQYYTLKQLQQPCPVVLSALAYLGHADDAAAAAAFAAGTAELASMDPKPRLAARPACAVQAVHEALVRPATVAAPARRGGCRRAGRAGRALGSIRGLTWIFNAC